MTTLHWSPRSPYVRKVMVALHEKGLEEQVETVRTMADPVFPPKDFMAVNPLAKIPTLEREAGQPIWDSRVVMEWADLTSDTGPRLFPIDPKVRMEAMTDEALGTGMLETGVTLLIERFMRDADKQDARIVEACNMKMLSALDYLNANAARLSEREFDAGHVSVGVALCYYDFRFGVLEWQKTRPALAEWHAAFLERPSVKATAFRDDARPTE